MDRSEADRPETDESALTAAGQGYARAEVNLDELRRQGRGVTPG